ncbi:MAG: hypothetical protein GOVbin2371_26 [Prokaryotic dsDNA virus sp.]|nr:MAG: hypothetical protein GOVbin2371_26 [Prokaryotic dsDNA virus sp.]
MNPLFNELFAAVQPVLMDAASYLLMAFLIWVGNTVRVHFGIEIEARHREAMHSAIMSGIRAALARGLNGPDAVQDVVDHVFRSTPDALHKLKPAPGVLENIIEGKLREVKDGLPIYGVDLGKDADTLTPAGAA